MVAVMFLYFFENFTQPWTVKEFVAKRCNTISSLSYWYSDIQQNEDIGLHQKWNVDFKFNYSRVWQLSLQLYGPNFEQDSCPLAHSVFLPTWVTWRTYCWTWSTGRSLRWGEKKRQNEWHSERWSCCGCSRFTSGKPCLCWWALAIRHNELSGCDTTEQPSLDWPNKYREVFQPIF